VFGWYWRTDYDSRLSDGKADGSNARALASIVRPDGTVQYFGPDGRDMQPNHARPVGSVARLSTPCPSAFDSACWEYKSGDGVIERYNGEGFLLSIDQMQLAHQRQTLSYDERKRLIGIVDEHGRRLAFGYRLLSYLATSATLPDGRVVEYRYDEGDRLVGVVPAGTSGGRIYHYEDPAFRYALTGVTDERGVRFSTYEYWPDGRVKTSFHAPGLAEGTINRRTYTYSVLPNGDFRTTSVNALGSARNHDHRLVSGALKLVAASQICTNCGSGSVQSVAYDSTGYPDLTTDFRGVAKNEDYGARGLRNL
jgi:YD repeat-containing protein